MLCNTQKADIQNAPIHLTAREWMGVDSVGELLFLMIVVVA